MQVRDILVAPAAEGGVLLVLTHDDGSRHPYHFDLAITRRLLTALDDAARLAEHVQPGGVPGDGVRLGESVTMRITNHEAN